MLQYSEANFVMMERVTFPRILCVGISRLALPGEFGDDPYMNRLPFV